MDKYMLILGLTLAQVVISTSEDPLIQLPDGQIQGRQDVTSENKAYYAFEKIPYGAPPVGDLRFKAPQPPEPWEGILNTTHLDISCYNMKMMMRAMPGVDQSEDCLYLNVATPKLPSEGDEELLPVMVWIYGGAFMGGSATNNPPDLFVNNDVILVSMNYRVGPFGFLSTQDEVIPGNAGLKDQLLALKWTNQNIHLFGGDPERVTIFGQSAGGGSCAYQLLNQESSGLFQGAILESGTFLSTGMFQRNSRKVAFATAATLNSTFESSDDSQALLDFLLTVDAEDLNEAANQYNAASSNSWDDLTEPGRPYAPVIEVKNPDAVLTRKQYGLLKAGNILKVPVLMGFTSEEKIGPYQDPESLVDIAATIDENLDVIVPADMQITDADSLTEMGRLIREIYTGGETFSNDLGGAVRYGSDTFLSRAMIKHAEIFSQFAETYFYQFSYDGSFAHSESPYEDAGNVGHGSELSYIFCSGTSCTDSSYPEEDLLARQRLITLWTNFAKYQHPTPEPLELLQNVTWPVVSTENGNFFYLDIGENLVVEDHPKGNAFAMWVALYDSLGYDDFDTY